MWTFSHPGPGTRGLGRRASGPGKARTQGWDAGKMPGPKNTQKWLWALGPLGPRLPAACAFEHSVR